MNPLDKATDTFEKTIFLNAGRYATNILVIGGAVMTVIGGFNIAEAYPERKKPEHPLTYFDKSRTLVSPFPDGSTTWFYLTRYPKSYSVDKCSRTANSKGIKLSGGEYTDKQAEQWNASLFGEAMEAFEKGEVVKQTKEGEYGVAQANSSGFSVPIAAYVNSMCERVIKNSKATSQNELFWEVRKTVLRGAADYGNYVTDFNQKEGDRKDKLMPSYITTAGGISIMFLSSILSGILAIERNTRKKE